MTDNGYEQETIQEEQWESVEVRQRPLWPKVIGIISIIWGSLGLICGGFGLVALPFSDKFVSAILENGEPTPYGMVPTATDYSIAGFGFLLAVLLLFAGITCVSYRPVTRKMHLLYGLISIPITLWSYMNQQHKAELNLQWAKEFPNSPLAESLDPAQNPAAGVGQIVGLALLIVLGFGVPLLYLIWFGLVKTKPEQITGGDEGVF